MTKRPLSAAIANVIDRPVVADSVQAEDALLCIDEAARPDLRSIDCIASATRFRFKQSKDLGGGMKRGL
jgi:hypothetical protein